MNSNSVHEQTVEELRKELEKAQASLREKETLLVDAHSQVLCRDAMLADANALLADAHVQISDREAQLADAHAEMDSLHSDLSEAHRSLNITGKSLDSASDLALSLRNGLMEWREGEPELSAAERRCLQGSGSRRFGFIAKVTEMMLASPEFIPPYLDRPLLVTTLEQLETVHSLNATIQHTSRLTGDVLLILGDNSFRMALMYYGAVRDASARNIPGARELFRILQQFFRRGCRTSEEPTEDELFSHIKGLIRRYGNES